MDAAPNFTPLFTSATYGLEEHVRVQTENKYKYLATLRTLVANGVGMLQGRVTCLCAQYTLYLCAVCKVRALAAAWARHDHDLSSMLLTMPNEQFFVVEVLKAVRLLDTGRQARQAERKMKVLLAQYNKLTGRDNGRSRIGRKIVALKKTINNLKVNL
jgi:hypothetical protein